MRFVIALLVGFVPGVLLGTVLLLWNPSFDTEQTPRLADANLELPIAGSGASVVTRSANGYPWIPSQPAFAPEPEVEGMHTAMTVMQMRTGMPDVAAYGVRLQTLSDDGRPLFGELIEESLFYVILPEAGSLIVSSRDDLWGFARQVSLPLVQSTRWQGNLNYRSTIGPSRGYADAVGLSGSITGVRGRAELMQSVRAVSLSDGITDGDSRVSIALDLPAPEASVASE